MFRCSRNEDARLGGIGCTHVHVQRLAVPLIPADSGGNDDELVLGDEVADAAFFARGLSAGMGLDVEFQGAGEG